MSDFTDLAIVLLIDSYDLLILMVDSHDLAIILIDVSADLALIIRAIN